MNIHKDKIKEEDMKYDLERIRQSPFVNTTSRIRKSITELASLDRDRSPFTIPTKLDNGKGLFIFAEKDNETNKIVSHLVNEKTNLTESPVWSTHFAQELEEAKANLPINGFEEMIELTHRGQLWTFPIDNEQGLSILKEKC